LKKSKIILTNLFLFFSVLLIHFDPIGLKITISFFFLVYLSFKFRINKSTIKYLILSSLVIITCIINSFAFNNIIFTEFFKSFLLLIFCIYFHIYYSTCSGLEKFSLDYRIFEKLLIIIFIISLLQFTSFIFFKSTYFYNLFGIFSYANEYNLDKLNDSTFPRVTGFYLEPSYLAFVVINLFIFLYLLNKFKLIHLFLTLAVLLMSGSRGGFIFFSLFLVYISFNTTALNFKNRGFIITLMLIFILFVFFSTNAFSILSTSSIVEENTSQYERIYLGYKFAVNVLNNYPIGIPLGQIEVYFQKLLNIDSSIFSFFFLLLAYFGYIGILTIIFIFLLIFVKYPLNTFIFLTIYILMYFNITGSVLAPDTYFWFTIFILLFRQKISDDKKKYSYI
jgi:hypothetical protein